MSQHHNSILMNIRRTTLHTASSGLYHTMLWLMVWVTPLLASSCITEDTYDDNPKGNFEALWKIMDEHYCFFNEKQVDWNAVHDEYAKRIDNGMSEGQLLEVLGDMLATLRDGHVNLYAGFDMARYWGFHENYPSNYQDTLINKYLGRDYKIAGTLRYRILDDNIGYIRCSTFSQSFGKSTLSDILTYLAPCNGLIIDLRNNGGGQITAAEELAARFTNDKTLVGYMQHKTGKGHSDFSSRREQRISPSNGVRWQKNVVVITNRAVYSAANEFVKYMKCFPRVTLLGDHTGGGAGLPFTNELPNGWQVRFSACPMYDANGRSSEDGIAPHHYVSLSTDDWWQGRDTLIEAARTLLNTLR